MPQWLVFVASAAEILRSDGMKEDEASQYTTKERKFRRGGLRHANMNLQMDNKKATEKSKRLDWPFAQQVEVSLMLNPFRTPAELRIS